MDEEESKKTVAEEELRGGLLRGDKDAERAALMAAQRRLPEKFLLLRSQLANINEVLRHARHALATCEAGGTPVAATGVQDSVAA